MSAPARPSTSVEPRPGDRYHLDARIATGGMGEVWRATDTVLGREVAVKVLKHEYADDPMFRSRFEAEARHAAALHHPNVASVFDFGELAATDGSGTGRPFLVMELVPGRPLSALLHGGEPMPPANAADLVAQAADAIAAAHALDIVHRDVKPANLLVTPDGTVKITDFGIARAADGVGLTLTGQIVGTPHYISPEQAEGRPATPLSDIYSLGVVLYECLAGHRPFTGETPVGTALAHLRDPVPWIPGDIPDQLRAVVDIALAKAPEDRFASAADMAAALRGGPVVGHPAGLVPGLAAGAPPGTPHGDAPTLVDRSSTQVMAPASALAGATRKPLLPLRGPWAAAAGVLVLVVLVVLLATLLGGGPDATGDDPAASPSAQPEDNRVRVRRAAYVGMDHDQAREDLERRGFDVVERPRENPGGNEPGSVAGVRPHGLVVPDAELTVLVWGEAPEPAVEPEPNDNGKAGKGEKGPSDAGEKNGKPKDDK